MWRHVHVSGNAVFVVSWYQKQILLLPVEIQPVWDELHRNWLAFCIVFFKCNNCTITTMLRLLTSTHVETRLQWAAVGRDLYFDAGLLKVFSSILRWDEYESMFTHEVSKKMMLKLGLRITTRQLIQEKIQKNIRFFSNGSFRYQHL